MTIHPDIKFLKKSERTAYIFVQRNRKIKMPQLAPKELCNGCEACANICAHGCISFQLNNTGFYYPLVNAEQCTNCGLCEKTCPILNNDSLTFRHIEYNDTIAYGAYIKTKRYYEIRFRWYCLCFGTIYI